MRIWRQQPALGQCIFLSDFSTSENWSWANAFISSEIQHQKTDNSTTCFFYWKSAIGKSTLSLCVFFIVNLTSEHRRQPNIFFFIRNPTSENWYHTNMFFHLKFIIRKVISGQRVVLIRNTMLENQRWANLSEIWHPKTDFQRVYFIRNQFSENAQQVNAFFSSGIWCRKTDISPTYYFHRKSNVGKLMSSNMFFTLEKLPSESQRWANVFLFIVNFIS